MALQGMGLLLGPNDGPHYGSVIWPSFRFHRNDNEQSRYHCGETGIGPHNWPLKLTPRGCTKRAHQHESKHVCVKQMKRTAKRQHHCKRDRC